MHRRHFLSLTAAALAARSAVAIARPGESLAGNALDFASVTYLSSSDDAVRGLLAQVSRWSDAGAASRYGVSILNQAGSDLPEGEFYQTEPVDHPIPPGEIAPPAMARGWQTIVGVAAYTTDIVLLVVQRDDLIWSFRTSGARDAGVLGITIDLAAGLVDRSPVGPWSPGFPPPMMAGGPVFRPYPGPGWHRRRSG